MSAPLERDAARRPTAGAEQTPIRRQLALLVGIDRYPVQPLANAVRDAAALAGLLRRDFGFELVGGTPSLDGAATGARVRRLVSESLQAAGDDTRWLFYFAGHGEVGDDGEGFLVAAGGRSPRVSMSWLVQRCLASGAGEALIVLDACYAGRALRRTELDPWIDTEATRRQGPVQLLAASNPFETASDAGGEGHSVFTQCLLEALDGRLGIHRADGTITFFELAARLGSEVDARLGGGGGQRVLAAALRASAEGHRGGFRFRPWWPRLMPGRVDELRDAENLRRRRDALRRLPDDCRTAPGELSDAERLAWNLPLALQLSLLDLAGAEREPLLGEGRPPMAVGPVLEREGQEVRAATAAALARLVSLHGDLALQWPETPASGPFEPERREEIERAARRASRMLLHLAVRDPDPAVRSTAARQLGRVLSPAEQRQVGRRLDRLRRRIRHRLWRRRLWSVSCRLPAWRRLLPPLRRARAVLGVAGGTSVAGVRWVLRHRVPRRVVAVLIALPLLASTTMLGTYHVGTDERRALIVRWGLPGFEALPGVGAPAVATDWHEGQLPGGRLPRADQPVGFWLSATGDLRWGRQLAARLDASEAAVALWRLGDGGAARERLLAAAGDGRAESVETAAYLAFHDPAFVLPTVESGLTLLAGSRDASGRRRALRALACLPRTRPLEARGQVEALVGRLATAPPADLPPLIEALAALAGKDPEPTRRALSRALERLSDPNERSVSRLGDAVRALLASHPQLAAEHHADVLAVARRPEQRDRFLGWVEALAGDGDGAQARARDILLDELGLPGPGRAAGLALLGRLLDRGAPLRDAELRLLAELADESDPELVLTAAELVAELPAPTPLAARFDSRLASLARRSDRPEVARRAVAALAELKSERALLTALDVADDGVRGSALLALVELALSNTSDTAALSTALARGFHDPSPWIRDEAARGILLLADRLVGRAAELYDAAFDHLAASIEGDMSRALGRQLGEDLQRAGIAARTRFCRRLARHLVSDRSFEAYAYDDLLRTLLEPGVSGGEVVAALAPLFADRRGETWAPTVIDRLRAGQRHSPQAFVAVVESLVADLAVDDPERRRAAARLIGPLAAAGGVEPSRVLEAMGATLVGHDPLAAAHAAASSFWLAYDRRGLAAQVTIRLAAALADERLEVRRAVAQALVLVAELEARPYRVPFAELERALADSDRTVRREVALALRLWSQRAPAAVDGSLDRLARRVEGEADATTRARLAVAAALMASDRGRPIEPWLAVLARCVDDRSSVDPWWEIGALAARRRRLAPPAIEMVRSRWRTLEDRRVAVLVVREIGRADADAGSAALDLLEEMLIDDAGSVGWDALINGVDPIVEAHAELLPRALALVERTLALLAASTDDGHPIAHPLGGTEQAARELWVELSVAEAVRDRHRLWRGLASASRGDRRAALEVLARLAAAHPELRPELARRLAVHQRSARPEVRLAAAVGQETLELLRFFEDPTRDADAKRLVLEAMPEVDLDAAMSIARDRLGAEEAERRRPTASRR